MPITIELSPEEEARLRSLAIHEGLPFEQWAKQRVLKGVGYIPLTPEESARKNAAAIQMLRQWEAEDATDDPDAIRKAEEDLDNLMQNLNRNRIEAGESPLFP